MKVKKINLDTTNDSESLMTPIEKDIRVFKHKNINHSCLLMVGNHKIDVIEGKVETSEVDVIQTLLKDGWIELSPKHKVDKPVKKKEIVEWCYKLPNQSKPYNGKICVAVKGKATMIDVSDSMVITKEKEIHEQLKKSGWLLQYTKEEIS